MSEKKAPLSFSMIVFLALAAFLLMTSWQPALAQPPLDDPPSTTPTPTATWIDIRPTLPPTWTPTFTPSPVITFTPSPTASLTPSPTAGPPEDATSGALVREVIVVVDELPLRVGPASEEPVIEYLIRGAVRGIIADTDALEAGEPHEGLWYYVRDGYGWLPAEIDGVPTTRAYTPEALEALIAETSQLIQTQGDDIRLYLQRGWMCYGQEDYVPAIADISHAIDLAQGTQPCLYEYRGKVYLDQEAYMMALRDLDQAITLGQEEGSTYNRRAVAYQELGNYAAARSDFERAIALNPDYGLLYSNVGVLRSRQYGNDLREVTYYTQAIEHDRFYPYAYSNRATTRRLSGEFSDRVVEDYTIAYSLVPDEVFMLNNRGIVYSRQGKPILAIDDYNRVLAIDPTYGDAYINRGVEYSNLRDNRRAIEDFLTAIHLDPNSALAYYDLGIALFQEHQYAAALYAYNRAIELNPNYNDALINRQQIYALPINLDEKAIEAYPNVEALITPLPE